MISPVRTYQQLKRIPIVGSLARTAMGLLYNPAVAQSIRRYDKSVNWRSGQQILVYTSGQVGSTAIQASLAAVPGDPYRGRVHHAHFLNPITIKADIPYSRWYFQDKGHILPHYLRSLFIQKQLDDGEDLSRIALVTAVRDPIRSNVAGFFQQLYRLPDFDVARLKESDEKLMDELTERYINTSDIHYHLTWLDYQVRDVFGIDVYSEEFPQAAGYKIYNSRNPQMLLLKTEMMNEVAETAMREFLQTDDFTLVRTNTAAEKDYAKHYKEFLRFIRIPERWFKTVEQSRFLRHFYTEEEQAKILDPWRDRLI